MKKILFSIGIVAAAAAVVAAGTNALFSDTETSAGNIFTAGSIDLKVDHWAQSYNGIDCKTCSVVLISDPTNMVVAKNGSPVVPYPAVYLDPIHPAWTAQNDPALVAANAKWIWEQNPVQQADTTVDTTYTFRKEFEWLGPITGSDLSMAVGHDNTVEVWLNNVLIGSGTDIYGFQIDHMLHIPGASITGNIIQGQNVLEIKLRNRAEPNGNPQNNPAGLIYKFEINGNCGEAYFQNHCTLWSEKDLTPNDHFWQFDDVKPGDQGTNLISLHAISNDAYMCWYVDGVDKDNSCTEPEQTAEAGLCVDPNGSGELTNYLKMFAWADDGDGVYEGEPTLYGPNMPIDTELIQMSLTSSQTSWLGLSWCAGNQNVVGNVISCDGSGYQNDAQTDSYEATATVYAVQQRNNYDFQCSDLFEDND